LSAALGLKTAAPSACFGELPCFALIDEAQFIDVGSHKKQQRRQWTIAKIGIVGSSTTKTAGAQGGPDRREKIESRSGGIYG
jgi:hypothetical protein